MTFHGIAPRESAVDACAAAVKEAILGGTLRPGARLPPERELAESLGVSRLTLRAGLGKLASVGLLSVKHGSGYSVRDYRRSGGIELLPGLARLARRRDQLAEIAADLLRVRRQLSRTVLEQVSQARLRVAAEWRPHDLAAVKAMAEDGRLSLDGLITHRHAAREAE